MANYAFLDNNNIVTEVITGKDETELLEGLTPEEWYGNFRGQRCVRTSYNANIRKNYAGIGFTYDEQRDAFIPPKPFNSWILNEDTCNWEAPIKKESGQEHFAWNEENLQWEFYGPLNLIQERIDICLNCPMYDSTKASCTICGCSSLYLHNNQNAICPEGKW